MEPQFGVIDNLVREYIWENSKRYNLSGKMDVWDEVTTSRHRNQQLFLFSPLIQEFYKDKKRFWKVKDSFLGVEVDSLRPKIKDLTNEQKTSFNNYDFDKSKRLALVCDQQFIKQRSGGIQVLFSILPLKEGEYSLIENSKTFDNFEYLNSFADYVKNNTLSIQDIPIELIARPGEIDRTKLRRK